MLRLVLWAQAGLRPVDAFLLYLDHSLRSGAKHSDLDHCAFLGWIRWRGFPECRWRHSRRSFPQSQVAEAYDDLYGKPFVCARVFGRPFELTICQSWS